MVVIFINKHLIKSGDKIHSLFQNEWADVTENIVNVERISQEEFETYGMDSLSDLPMKTLNKLDEFEILTYSDDVGEELEEVSVGVEQQIDTGKLFKLEIEDFDGMLEFPTLE